MDLKRLGTSFGVSFLSGLVKGKDARTSFREAGIGAVVGETFVGKPDITHSIELIARGYQLSQQIDRPVGLDSMARSSHPSPDQYQDAADSLEGLLSVDIDTLYAADNLLQQYMDGMKDARALITQARAAKAVKEEGCSH